MRADGYREPAFRARGTSVMEPLGGCSLARPQEPMLRPPIRTVECAPELRLDRYSVTLNLPPEIHLNVVAISGLAIVNCSSWAVRSAIATTVWLVIRSGRVDIMVFGDCPGRHLAMAVVRHRVVSIRILRKVGRQPWNDRARRRISISDFAGEDVAQVRYGACTGAPKVSANELAVLKLRAVASLRELSIHSELIVEGAPRRINALEIRTSDLDFKRGQAGSGARVCALESLLAIQEGKCFVANLSVLRQTVLFLSGSNCNDVVLGPVAGNGACEQALYESRVGAIKMCAVEGNRRRDLLLCQIRLSGGRHSRRRCSEVPLYVLDCSRSLLYDVRQLVCERALSARRVRCVFSGAENDVASNRVRASTNRFSGGGGHGVVVHADVFKRHTETRLEGLPDVGGYRVPRSRRCVDRDLRGRGVRVLIPGRRTLHGTHSRKGVLLGAMLARRAGAFARARPLQRCRARPRHPIRHPVRLVLERIVNRPDSKRRLDKP